MKMLSLIGIVSLAFHTMIFAQTDFGVSLGASSSRETQESPRINSPVMPGLKVGGYLRHNILKGKFAVGIDINYSFLFGANEFKISDTYEIENVYSLPLPEYLEPLEHSFETNYHQITTPVYLMWNGPKLKPLIGVYYNYKRSTKKYDINNPFDSGDDKYNVNFNSFGIYAGVHYTLSDKISLGLNYSHGLNKSGINYKSNDLFFQAADYCFRNSQLDFTLYYTFGKRKDKEE